MATATLPLENRPIDGGSLIDSFGRIHDSLRISVTDRCNVRCFYCMPETDVHFVPRAEILNFEEIERFARIAASLGVTKLRVTGGEPLMRRDLPVLIRRLAGIPGIRDLALTTNGVLLPQLAAPLYDAGLRRLNVHIDTLDRERFAKITRRDDLPKVLAGLSEAKRLGYPAIKLNAVAVKNLVEPDIVPLARYARENGFEPRYIEFMPLDAQAIAVEAKWPAHRRDESHASAAIGVFVFRRGRARVWVRDRGQRRNFAGQRLDDLIGQQHLASAPETLRIERHEFDVARLKAIFAGVKRQRNNIRLHEILYRNGI